jgi:hypothetical protein
MFRVSSTTRRLSQSLAVQRARARGLSEVAKVGEAKKLIPTYTDPVATVDIKSLTYEGE